MPKVMTKMPDAQAAKPPTAPPGPKPAAKPAVAKPAAPPPEQAEEPRSHKLLYPHIEVRICDGGEGEGHRPPLDVNEMQAYLGWEDEEAYAERMTAGMSEADKARCAFSYGDTYHFLDMNGKKVKCWNNVTNRPFDRDHALSLAQDLLSRGWSDSRNGGTAIYELDDEIGGGEVELPEMTLNGETIIVTREGSTNSGQHRLIGGVFAHQIWDGEGGARWKEKWPEAPTMEAIVVLGVSDDPRVTMTLDNVMPRSEADTIYTTMFQNFLPPEKKELSRYLALATDVLWDRTGADDGGTNFRTHKAAQAFRERHPTLAEMVLHVFEENRGRGISKLKLSAGVSAGLAYLFAASGTNPDAYRAEQPSDRGEGAIDFDAMVPVLGQRGKVKVRQAAELFISKLAKAGDTQSDDRALAAIADELVRLAGVSESGASPAEKTGILCLAWGEFANGNEVKQSDLKLTYITKEDGSKSIEDHPNVGGIDIGVEKRKVREKDPDAPTPEQIKADKAEAQRMRAEEQKKLVQEAQQRVKGVMDTYNKTQAQHPGKLLLWKVQSGSWASWGETAKKVIAALKLASVAHPDGVARSTFPGPDLEANAKKLAAAGYVVCRGEEIGGKVVVTDVAAPKIVDMTKPAAKATKPTASEKNGAAKPAMKPSAAKPAPKVVKRK